MNANNGNDMAFSYIDPYLRQARCWNAKVLCYKWEQVFKKKSAAKPITGDQ